MLALAIGKNGQYARLGPVWYRAADGTLQESSIEVRVLRINGDGSARLGIQAAREIEIDRLSRDGRQLSYKIAEK